MLRNSWLLGGGLYRENDYRTECFRANGALPPMGEMGFDERGRGGLSKSFDGIYESRLRV